MFFHYIFFIHISTKIRSLAVNIDKLETLQFTFIIYDFHIIFIEISFINPHIYIYVSSVYNNKIVKKYRNIYP